MTRLLHVSILVALVMELGACATMPNAAMANSPIVMGHLQMVSAGHTGSEPNDNRISNVNAQADGSGTWNATCKEKVYLCSAVGSVGSSAESFSRAPAVN